MTGSGTESSRPCFVGGPSAVLVRRQLAVNIGRRARWPTSACPICGWSSCARDGHRRAGCAGAFAAASGASYILDIRSTPRCFVQAMRLDMTGDCVLIGRRVKATRESGEQGRNLTRLPILTPARRSNEGRRFKANSIGSGFVDPLVGGEGVVAVFAGPA